MFSSFHKVARRWFASARTVPTRRLSVETLEDRVLLATRIWDGGADGSNAPFTDANWSSAQNWEGDVAPVAGDNLRFPLTALQSTAHNDFAAGTTFNSISFSGSGYTLDGNGLSLTAGVTTSNASGVNILGMPVSLAADAVFRSGVVGTNLVVSGPSLDNGGHNWIVDGAGDALFAGGSITGAGGLTKTGSGQLILGNSAANTYAGATTVGGGTLLLWGNGVAVPGALTVSTTVRLTAAEQIGDTAPIRINSDGLLDLNGFVETVGPLTMHSGRVTTGKGTLVLNGDVTTLAASDPSVLSGKLSLGSTAVRTFNVGNGDAEADLNVTAVVRGAADARLVKKGRGRMRLGAANTYAGETLVQQGTLQVSNARALGDDEAGTTVVTGASLLVESSGAEPLVLNGNGDANLAGGGALQANANAALTWSGPITLASPSTVRATDDTVLDVAGRVTGCGDLIKTGSGVVRLSHANDYTGATVIRAGILAVRNATALGYVGPNSGTTVTGSGTLQLEGHNTFAPEPLTLQGLGSGDVSALHSVGSNTWTGPITLAATSQVNVTSSATLTICGTVGGPAGSDLVIGRSGASWHDGTVLLTSANSYAGATRVAVGRLAVRNATALGHATDTANAGTSVYRGATLELRGDIAFDPTETLTLNGAGHDGVGALYNRSGNNTWAAPVTLKTDATISAASATTLTLSGVVGGTADVTLTKDGAGTVVLTAANIYSGATVVADGTLAVRNAAALGAVTGETRVKDGATLALRGCVTFNAEPLKLNGTLRNDTGRNTWTGDITLAGDATVTADGGTRLTVGGPRSGSVANGGYLLTVSGAGDVDIAYTISGKGGLTKTGSGTLTFSGASPNTYAGATKVNGGTLRLAKAAAAIAAIAGSGLSLNGGTLEGSGLIRTSVANSGVIRIGGTGTIGTLTITGDYTQTLAGRLEVELAGTAAGEFDRLEVRGTAALNGTLDVSRLDGYLPNVGDAFAVMNFASSVGTFATVNGLDLGNGRVLDLVLGATQLTLVTRQV